MASFQPTSTPSDPQSSLSSSGDNLKPSAVESETKETDVNSVVDKFSTLSTQEIEKIRHIQATHAHLTSDITFDDPSLRM